MDAMTRQKQLQEDTHFKVLGLLEQNPDMSQRDLAKVLGVSLGGLNYSLKALMERGMVRAQNFSKSERKLACAYVLTPQGLGREDQAHGTLPQAQDGGVRRPQGRDRLATACLEW